MTVVGYRAGPLAPWAPVRQKPQHRDGPGQSRHGAEATLGPNSYGSRLSGRRFSRLSWLHGPVLSPTQKGGGEGHWHLNRPNGPMRGNGQGHTNGSQPTGQPASLVDGISAVAVVNVEWFRPFHGGAVAACATSGGSLPGQPGILGVEKVGLGGRLGLPSCACRQDDDSRPPVFEGVRASRLRRSAIMPSFSCLVVHCRGCLCGLSDLAPCPCSTHPESRTPRQRQPVGHWSAYRAVDACKFRRQAAWRRTPARPQLYEDEPTTTTLTG